MNMPVSMYCLNWRFAGLGVEAGGAAVERLAVLLAGLDEDGVALAQHLHHHALGPLHLGRLLRVERQLGVARADVEDADVSGHAAVSPAWILRLAPGYSHPSPEHQEQSVFETVSSGVTGPRPAAARMAS